MAFNGLNSVSGIHVHPLQPRKTSLKREGCMDGLGDVWEAEEQIVGVAGLRLTLSKTLTLTGLPSSGIQTHGSAPTQCLQVNDC